MARDTPRFLHLARPLAPTGANYQNHTGPLSVTIQSQAIVSILDHATRRDIRPTPTPTNESAVVAASSSSRVIGALVGTRSEDGAEINVSSSFAIPHTENEDQVEVDVEYQKNMLSLHLRAHPREVLLGWYSTTQELNSFSALIQNFFASPETGTFPHPAIHLTVSADPGSDIKTRAYISSPVAVNAERASESCLFMPVLCRVGTSDAERAALDIVGRARDNVTRSAPVITDVEALTTTLEHTLSILDRVSDYVGAVIDEEREPNNALGQYLIRAVSLAPKVDPATIESDFNNHIQDVLMISYLANSIRTQIGLSQRLATAVLADGDKVEGKDGDAKDGKGERGERGGRGGKRGGRGGGRGGGQREPREPREPRENG
ncbi:Mov34-domain-containing protein, partial [Hypoxylon fragiforme]|uniref:Mov34-domain-containing protein n=1 Tax=Hypoxylon fragiforme TaxID=63214 RepID=UPI0020C5FA98